MQQPHDVHLRLVSDGLLVHALGEVGVIVGQRDGNHFGKHVLDEADGEGVGMADLFLLVGEEGTEVVCVLEGLGETDEIGNAIWNQSKLNRPKNGRN